MWLVITIMRTPHNAISKKASINKPGLTSVFFVGLTLFQNGGLKYFLEGEKLKSPHNTFNQ